LAYRAGAWLRELDGDVAWQRGGEKRTATGLGEQFVSSTGYKGLIERGFGGETWSSGRSSSKPRAH
jgi:hypothetical protein